MRRKVKAGIIEADHEECAIIVHYEVEATVLGELGEPIVAERQVRCSPWRVAAGAAQLVGIIPGALQRLVCRSAWCVAAPGVLGSRLEAAARFLLARVHAESRRVLLPRPRTRACTRAHGTPAPMHPCLHPRPCSRAHARRRTRR